MSGQPAQEKEREFGMLAAVEENNGDEDCSSGEGDVQLRKRLQPEDEATKPQRASEGSTVGAIQSLGSATTTERRSWATFTSNATSRSVAESVHQHRQQFLQNRARFNPGTANNVTSESSSVTKRFEIELRALGLGTSTPRSNPDGESWIKHGKNGDKSKSPSPSTFQRQGSVRMRVKSFDAMSGQ